MKGPIKVLVLVLVLGVAGIAVYLLSHKKSEDQVTQIAPLPPPASPPVGAQPNTAAAAPGSYDLAVQGDGMSKAVATLTMDNGSVVKLRFYTNEAPNTAKRIAELISQGFYNGITFHRVVPGFVVQAGDPTGRGDGGSGVKLKPEFNFHKHELGVWSMARTQDPNSADSQFFIMLGAAPSLDGQYTAFGKVIDGIDNVQHIKQGDKIKTFTIQ